MAHARTPTVGSHEAHSVAAAGTAHGGAPDVGAEPAFARTPAVATDPAHGTTAAATPADATVSTSAAWRDGRSSTPLPAGLRLGHFKIERELGSGGMGEVYLASDLALDRPVAIKVLPAGAGSVAARDRMIREARAQARVHHPNVAHIYFIGEEQDRLYFAMEHVKGETLAERVARGALSVEEALELIRGSALGLREAQRAGITHRDVKPSNLMVDSHGVVKVLDFGLAADGPRRAGEGPVAQTTLAGTPLYMAPEQARGEPIDLRADIYALGATLYHLVAGRPPFQADTVHQLTTLHASAARPPLPRGANPRTAIAAIDALIVRMMAVDPEDRFASYDELLHAVELASLQHTRPAGFVVRTIATTIDLLLVLIVLGVASLIVKGTDGDLTLEVGGNLLALAYTTAAIARWGTTAGKSLFELEVVSISKAQRPTWAQALRRQLYLIGFPFLATCGASISGALDLNVAEEVFDWLGAAAALLPIISLLYASARVPGKRAGWDRASGTLVRYRSLRNRR